MARKETRTQKIIRLVIKRFPSVAETDIEQIIHFALKKRNELLSAQRREIGDDDDARDYINTAYFLRSLSNRALSQITNLEHSEIRQQLNNGVYPFSQLNKKTREQLLHLPTSWIRGSANCLLHDKRL